MVIPGIQPYNNSLFNIIQPSVHPLSNPDYNSINGQLYNLASFPFLEMFLLPYLLRLFSPNALIKSNHIKKITPL